MKKIKLLSLALIFSIQLTAQNILPVNDTLTKRDYQRKSKNQLAGGLISTGMGLFLMGYGASIHIEKNTTPLYISFNGYQPPPPSSSEGGNSVGGLLIVVGCVATITGIIVIAKSQANRKKSMALSFTNKNAPVLQMNAIVNKPVPSIALQLRF